MRRLLISLLLLFSGCAMAQNFGTDSCPFDDWAWRCFVTGEACYARSNEYCGPGQGLCVVSFACYSFFGGHLECSQAYCAQNAANRPRPGANPRIVKAAYYPHSSAPASSSKR
jgi:hypothetical protein